ncbi:MAG TPA: type II toxin-antitoxin system HipA family toxin, partial [Epsilonproteobacteria bacterium]|nr:type II toxin-antitoxin system HipA family toxin [Campylobacterota bacterium]
SPHLPLKGEIPSGSIKRFLENLLPEGKGLEALTHFHRISKNNIFALIQAIGFETAGALNFGNIDDSSVPLFRPISKMELEERIDTIEEQSIIIWDQKQRLSLAGVQEKLPVMIKNGEIGLADGALSSTHILKFQTQRYMHIVANEYFCMSLAKSIGLPVANVALQRFGVHPVLVVERFDRRLEDDTITRLHVIDGCQILDLPSSYKYERNFGSGRDVKEIREGVSFRKLFEAANKCQVPAKAKLQLLEWSIFNLIIGNSDAHGKNISFFVSHSGYSVAPHYDILSVLMHEGIDHELAMSFGDTFDPGEIKGYPLREFAEEIDLPPKLVSDRINRLCKKVLQALEKDTISDGFFNSHEKEFVQHLSNLMKRRAEELSLSAEEMLKVSW